MKPGTADSRLSLSRLPPMTALRAFVVAAQHRSFVRAADALNVTPAAIGQQIRQLEAHLGQSLFHRDRRQHLVPTETALRLLPGLVDGFNAIMAAVQQLTVEDGDLPLNVSVAPSFGLKWLLPRLHRLRERHGHFDVRINTSAALVDFSREQIDCAIRFGAGHYEGLYSELLLSDFILPVCAPSLLNGANALTDPAMLRHHTLLHDDGESSAVGAPDWRSWLKLAGLHDIDANRGPRFDQALMVIEAAIAGQGVALARSNLVSDDLAAGRLVHPFGDPKKVQHSYYFVCPPHQLPSRRIQLFLTWLKEEAAQEAPLLRTPASPLPLEEQGSGT